MSKTCKTCQYWTGPAKHPLKPHSMCKKLSARSGWENRDPVRICVWVDDDTGLDTELHTQADFGCNQWEAVQ